MDRNQPITTYRCDLLNPPRKPMFPERSVRVSDRSENLNVRVIRFWETLLWHNLRLPYKPNIFPYEVTVNIGFKGIWAGSLAKT